MLRVIDQSRALQKIKFLGFGNFSDFVPLWGSTAQYVYIGTVEPRFNEVAGDRPYLFVISRFRYIENLDITNLRGNDQKVRYIEVIVND